MTDAATPESTLKTDSRLRQLVDFGGLLAEDLPQFDFIVAHGVWSWVPAARRWNAALTVWVR